MAISSDSDLAVDVGQGRRPSPKIKLGYDDLTDKEGSIFISVGYEDYDYVKVKGAEDIRKFIEGVEAARDILSREGL